MFIVILVCMLVLVVAAMLWWRIDARRKYWAEEERRQQKTQEFLELLEQAEGGSPEAQQELYRRGRHFRALAQRIHEEDRLRNVLDHEQQRRDRVYFNGQVARVVKLLSQSPIHHRDVRDGLQDLIDRMLPRGHLQRYAESHYGATVGNLGEGVQWHMEQEYQELLAAAEHDSAALDRLLKLIQESRGGRHGARHQLRSLEIPKNWGELVLRHHGNPSLDWFIDEEHPHRGRLRLRAVAALRDRDEEEAVRVLAWCNSSSEWREEVGEEWINRLVRMLVENWKQKVASQAHEEESR